MEYVVLLQPALFVIAGVLALVALFKGFYRDVPNEDGYARLRFRSGVSRRVAVPLLALALLAPAIVVTPPGHRGVIFSQSGGVQSNERVEGLSFILPYFQSAIQMDVRTQKYEVELFAQTLDLQEITVPMAVNYNVLPEIAAELYQEVGRDYEDTIIRPAALQIGKQSIGLVKAVDFARERAALAEDIFDSLYQELLPRGIVVTFVAVEDAVFDPLFIIAVKNKVIADERASEQERLVAATLAEAEQVRAAASGVADAILVEAMAQAEANEILALSLSLDLLTWQRILQWDGSLPNTLLSGGEADILLNVQ